MGKCFSTLRKIFYPEKDETAIINDLKKQLFKMEKSIKDLEKIHNLKRQGHGQPESHQKQSDLPVEGSEMVENMHASGKDPNAAESKTDMTNELKRKHFEMQEVLKRLEDSSNGCPAEMDNSEKNKVVIQIQLCCPQETSLTDYAMQVLHTELTSPHIQDEMKLNILTCKTLSNVQTCTPLIVICPSSSRLLADFKSTVSKLQTGSNTAVLIFHHLKLHALPTQPSSTILTGPEVKRVGIIIDVAFFEGMGMYECDMNRNAVMTLITFIKDYCKK